MPMKGGEFKRGTAPNRKPLPFFGQKNRMPAYFLISVFKNRYKEIGWHPVFLTEEGKRFPVWGGSPFEFTAFHWHGDTFELPSDCVRLAGSAGCANQAF